MPELKRITKIVKPENPRGSEKVHFTPTPTVADATSSRTHPDDLTHLGYTGQLVLGFENTLKRMGILTSEAKSKPQELPKVHQETRNPGDRRTHNEQGNESGKPWTTAQKRVVQLLSIATLPLKFANAAPIPDNYGSIDGGSYNQTLNSLLGPSSEPSFIDKWVTSTFVSAGHDGNNVYSYINQNGLTMIKIVGGTAIGAAAIVAGTRAYQNKEKIYQCTKRAWQRLRQGRRANRLGIQGAGDATEDIGPSQDSQGATENIPLPETPVAVVTRRETNSALHDAGLGTNAHTVGEASSSTPQGVQPWSLV